MGLMGIMEDVAPMATHKEVPVRRPQNAVQLDENGAPKKGGVMTGTTIMAVHFSTFNFKHLTNKF